MAQRLEGKVAVVTGGASGIGFAIAEAFLREGSRVVIGDITPRVHDVVKGLGPSASGFLVDVTKSVQVADLLQHAVSTFGGLDILCNNAGLDGVQTSLVDYNELEFDHVVAVNLKGPFLGMKHAIPLLRQRGGGAIVNTASIAGSVVMPNMPAYCAAKAGVMQLTKVAAVESARDNIRVNSICPGVIRTQMVEGLPPEFIAGLEKSTPAGRIADPKEVANLAVFLASAESPFLTGVSINIDGGFTLL
ncbi:SDR family oxidoreductase [Sphingobium phenoxybenzoativorans]|uniref:SDR family oxidoreductase n=1 Tax=Sphingobium phenoxybenzoativorans TaxID=1592790 RepID=A0A975K8P4_9SPHN|nr:SDR family NAD(P)-dependent oxidoreductase [Sphingobium phenoxybenzoativorans]QUT06861.1 SDR family oxidoreductase [Sphingobium phenoxybenzoativorans]